MSRRRRKKDSEKALELVLWILFCVPLALFFIIKWIFSGLSKLGSQTKTIPVEKQYNSTTQLCDTPLSRPYDLKVNELAQGAYKIGVDIPAGTYDFFVVHGNGGQFDIAKYDDADKVQDGTWSFYWVGLKEEYEKKELIHIECPEGYTIKISGSVVLKIAKSKNVTINL